MNILFAWIGLFALIGAYWAANFFFSRYLQRKYPGKWAELDRPLGQFDRPLGPESIGTTLRTMRFIFLSRDYKSLGDQRVDAYVLLIRVLFFAALGYIVIFNLIAPVPRH